jgi:acyl-coenzyme A thioesterase PaaI-like protein
VAAGGYPPPGHFLGDLGFRTELLGDTSAVGRTRVTRFVAGADGGARAGVLATLVDVVGGLLGVRVLQPDWMATADLTLQLVRPATGPFVEARADLVRRGRTTMVIEALIFNVEEDGTEVPDREGASAPVAWSTTTFAVLPGGNRTASQDLPFGLPPRLDIGSAGLDQPVLDRLGISRLDAARGRISLPVGPYVHNSIRGVQGGVMALLGDAAAAEALGAATGLGASGVVVTDLQVAYLTLGRAGPIVTRATVLDGGGGMDGGGGPDGAAGSAVVELVDTGAGDRLTTVINTRGMAAHAFDASRPPAPAGWPDGAPLPVAP